MSAFVLAFCTGNPGKFTTAREHLAPWDIEIEQVPLELDEIQTTSVEEIARHKARQAFARLQRPLFVEDSGFYIEEFGGWPGPMVKHALEALGPAGLTHLADRTEKRIARFASAAVYVDADGQQHVFGDDTRAPGTIAAVPRRGTGERAWSDLWSIFIPQGADTTLSALPPEEQDRFFAQWCRTSVVAAMGVCLAGQQDPHRVEA
ncbi:non-canonical purine NTP pyrophosphatase [Streptomyces lydicus]|uniref:non-canonical purine NTP pyrophosphatase n=1 Tax=Streptomyces lydicus TaxID=47763 RepID=UPI0037B67E0D